MSRTMNCQTAGTKLPLNLPILSDAREKRTVIVLLSLLQVMKRCVRAKQSSSLNHTGTCTVLWTETQAHPSTDTVRPLSAEALTSSLPFSVVPSS